MKRSAIEQVCDHKIVPAVQVLVEGENPKDAYQAMGRSRHNKLVFFPGNGKALKGSLIKVHIDEIRAYTLSGHCV